MRTTKRWQAGLGAPVLVLALGACGGGGSDGGSGEGSGSGDSGESMDDMDMDAMNDPDATPADEVDGEVTSGTFTVLDTAPPGSEGVTGQAFLGQNDSGTTVTVRLAGLEPETEYVGHLHAQACSADNGGEHFQFEKGGSEEPPNEIHLGFTSDDGGEGEATVTNDRQVGVGAPSVVIHPADGMDNRLACADFS